MDDQDPVVSKRPSILYFCDESHIRTSDWMGIGGLAVLPARAAQIEKELAGLKQLRDVPLHSEVKWTKAKSKPLLCRDYIDLMFRLIADGHVNLHVRFSPFKEYDHVASGPRRETDTVSKAYYQLLLHRAGRYYGNTNRILVRPDAGECTEYLPQVIPAINHGIRWQYGAREDAITNLQPKDSKSEPMLQLLDVTLGALCAARNGGHLKGELSDIKTELVHHVLAKCGVKINENHDPRDRRFNIWNVKPKWPKGAVPTR